MRTRSGALAFVMTAVLVLTLAWAAGCAVRRGAGAEHHRIPTVAAGSARFQILSPTLIRTEYASDRKFVDQPTFNVIGRGNFAPADYTVTSIDGWLTIATSAMTLRYKTDSGPFTPRNLILQLKSGDQNVTATPWQRPTCVVGVICEAEELTPTGAAVQRDHRGYSGGGFLAGFRFAGDGLTTDVDADSPGRYQFVVRYANAQLGEEVQQTRTFSLAVDGYPSQTLILEPSADWDTWRTAAIPVDLAKGHHTLRLSRNTSDSGAVNIDTVAVVAPGAQAPQLSREPLVDCGFNVTCEAEGSGLRGTATVVSDRRGYSGTGFVNDLNPESDLLIRAVGVPADGLYTLHIRYANARQVTRTATLRIGDVSTSVALPATADWNTWATAEAPVALKAGTNDIVLGCSGADACRVNVDAVAVTAQGAKSPAPHVPLGGYRRSFDTVNGDLAMPSSTPGLLQRDGWYLLDDSASAMFDPTTNELSSRPENRGAYLDGYLFGYGDDYQRGLGDLATLTGPPALLPQWAYGVWYSEDHDRTADSLQTEVVPQFRAQGVPLDVLVLDTPKFPSPEGFLDWANTQGLHTVFNVHPSLVESNPGFAEVQAVANNRLAGGDPWSPGSCCDGPQTPTGATPDAWINQQYAEAAEKDGRRGFVLSRAYGSLQSSGYVGPAGTPTGPWADKRTTIHFTGDTYSTWGTLAGEVGWTPAESVATGMAAVSHDIGGFLDATGLVGSETDGSGGRTKKLPDDLYVRWLQLGTFQPIDRLHGDHSDRMPWQYGVAAKESAKKFLNLRENLLPYIYTLADTANRTGLPIARPLYLEYPHEEQAYAAADSEYLFGSDLLVAPITAPGDSVTRSVWFPPGSWTNYFTGEAVQGGATHQITSGLDAMPVFVKAGAIIPMRTSDVAYSGAPMRNVTLVVAQGAPGTFTLYEDDGAGGRNRRGATTKIDYAENAGTHTIRIDSTDGTFRDQEGERQWTISVLHAAAPASVTINGRTVAPSNYGWDSATGNLRITLPAGRIQDAVTVTYQ
ncbi:hypothetical protein GGC64_001928 [Mycobacterium sp. OAS707]|uniref:TIM-barrel domain-containing protein n=1 Tax=Mycobacterium sp. OAS707 TaxID=2663822 RepID=UPI001A0F32CE|nr:hypothetical protein [Mycobacterium sp. OAS707]